MLLELPEYFLLTFHSCAHVRDRITAQLEYCCESHLMQCYKRPVLGKDEVIVSPSVVATVPQLDHVEDALTHLASNFVMVLHPTTSTLDDDKYQIDTQTAQICTKHKYNLIDQPNVAPLLFLPFQ